MINTTRHWRESIHKISLAQRQIGKGKIISDTDWPKQESPKARQRENVCTWLILFDVLLTMLNIDKAKNDLYIDRADHF